MNTVVVVGGAGFIGTRLSKRFASTNVNFRLVDKVPSESFPEHGSMADVRSLDDLRAVMPENSILINLAAEHRDDVRPRSLYDDVNVQGARNLCQVAEEKGIKTIIFTSSVAVYGFASPGTDESGKLNPFNDYGRTKAEAEQIFLEWQGQNPDVRSLVIIRPTVVFGERNRGNVYNLLSQIASGRFIMIGKGLNRKSMAYVENVAAFIEYSLGFGPGIHLFNYIDKPDLDMNTLVISVRRELGRAGGSNIRLPYPVGYGVGKLFDILASFTRKSFPVSSVRVKKFCSTTQFDTSLKSTGFVPPVSLEDGLRRTVRYEFLENHQGGKVFYTE